ncbi:MAG: UDP-glucose 6-dehydrogenase [Candidatus Woesebacteria bacterium GW2011_GWB1_43_14]|uniref:UDP-glucose 6-dehydrogenase n=1 Tax=Candidatus Woesebacteria bacterium GW2011_GWB1_43_14 TaxID=1618578 RepID=A0A0G1DML0_9BACT|nr:MAG: UDP-glucose 6-dehydrogenase [Candidatus Woesebacteria bacterium GW2011_GWC1_42_9]KKS98797.1 MAG: UDP-glucose 6-dehydrogenase [Candidatus Woesebacteria bacterium GW2011_GWB1_43_14]
MKIAVVGLWHSGEVYSGCLADLGNHIIGIDKNSKIVNNLNRGIAPLAEPKLEDIINRNIKKGRLKYITDFSTISSCDAIWMTIDTPIDKAAHGNLSKIFTYIKKSLPFIKNGAILIISSQLPVGTSKKIIKFIKANRKNFMFDYAYIPENLQLGKAVDSFMKPSRVVIGTDDIKRLEVIIKIFEKLKTNILLVNIASAEMVKHATNAFLATSLSFIYDIADVCEKVGADVTEVSQSLRADSRIGEKAYLDASAGFSGGHLDRDLQYLRKIAKDQKLNLPVISSVLKKNKKRSAIVFERISPLLKTFQGKTITFWGITYKSGTPTLTHSLPLKLAKEAVSQGSKINLCDLWVNKDDIKGEINGEYGYFTDPYESVKSSNATICITPWPELKNLNFKKIARSMANPKIFFDARNYFNDEKNIIERAGIKYIGVGR